MQSIIDTLLRFPSLRDNSDIYNSIKEYLYNVPKQDVVKELSVMKATYYIGSGKNQIITDIFLMLPKLN
jgi:hypothetical protein